MSAITQNQTPYLSSAPVAIPPSPKMSFKAQPLASTSPSSSPKEDAEQKVAEFAAKLIAHQEEGQKLAREYNHWQNVALEHSQSVSSDSSSEESSPRKAPSISSKNIGQKWETDKFLSLPFAHFSNEPLVRTIPQPNALQAQLKALQMKEAEEQANQQRDKRFSYWSSEKAKT